MTEAIASVKPRRKVPVIWFVPIVAALLGIWMVVYHYINEGPEISITFNTADGIQPGKTVYAAFTADKIGRFIFMCTVFCGDIHQHMEGTLIVRDKPSAPRA